MCDILFTRETVIVIIFMILCAKEYNKGRCK